MKRRQQVLEQVVDRDGLRHHAHPARSDHERQALHQRANHLERQAARSNDDGCAKLEHGDAGRAQNASDLLATAEVR